MLTKYGLPLAALVLLVFAFVHVSGANKPTQAVAPPVEPARNPFPETVAGAGIVEPRTENISVGTPLAGVVTDVFVEVGQRVPAGAALFRLDDRQLSAELSSRQAMLAAARAELDRLEQQPRPEEVPVSEARVALAEADLKRHLDRMTRARQLYREKVVTEQQLLDDEQAFQMSQASLSEAKAQLELLKAGAWQSDKAIALAAVAQAEAQVEQIRTELERLTVRALVPAEVLMVDVRPGEFVGAPATKTLIVLGDIDQLHIRVDIDEHDIPRLELGAPARAMVRGRPDEEYTLRFVRVEPFVIPKRSLTGDNTERVDTRVLQLIYAVDRLPDQRLYVGQQMDVFIDATRQKPAATIAAPSAKSP